jgi:hypothetical protein
MLKKPPMDGNINFGLQIDIFGQVLDY